MENNLPPQIVLMGVSGSGKSTVSQILANRYDFVVGEADDFHPPANVQKMNSGVSLTDEDRWPWLNDLASWMQATAESGQTSIVTCSALKKSYRDVLRGIDAPVIFVHLNGGKTLLSERMAGRKDHFMPASLLDSQLATLEPLEVDENGVEIDIVPPPPLIADEISKLLGLDAVIAKRAANAMQKVDSQDLADVGVYGLGVMGASLARNFARHGYRVAVFNIDRKVTEDFVEKYGHEATGGDFIKTSTEREFAESLSGPRKIFLMVTAGSVVDAVSNYLVEYLDEGDTIVDMGNSHYADTRRRDPHFAKKGINFVGCGTSGGKEGALEGPSLMVGGSGKAYKELEPLLTSIAAQHDGKPCCGWFGTDGAGHFVKTIHNGIEYADMQIISEVYSLMRFGWGMELTEIADAFDVWNNGRLNSYLMEITSTILRAIDPETNVPMVDIIRDSAAQKGTGAWASQAAFSLSVPATMIAEATLVRSLSAQHVNRSTMSKNFPRTRLPDRDRAFPLDELEKALYSAKLIAYAQGFNLISQASEKYSWGTDLAELAEVWRAGCIIRAGILDNIAAALRDRYTRSLLTSQEFRVPFREAVPALRMVVKEAIDLEIGLPAMSAALSYFDGLRQVRLGTSLVQGQRDFFGDHGFERVDKSGQHHHDWTGA